MSLTIALKIDRQEFLLGEDPILTIALANNTPDDIEFLEPEPGAEWPMFRLVGVHTGQEQLFGGKPPPGPRFRPRFADLEPRETKSFQRTLSSCAKIDSPGEYLLSAIIESGDPPRRIESEPIKFNVKSFVGRGLTINNPSNVCAELAFINDRGEASEIVLADVVLAVGGGISNLRRVAPAPEFARPVLSRPPNRAATIGRWIAWIEESSLCAVHSSDQLGPTSIARAKLPGPGAIITGPIFSASNIIPAVRARGEAAIICLEEGTIRWRFRSFELKAEGDKAALAPIADVPFPWGRPEWIQCLYRSDPDRKFVLFAVQDKGKTKVYVAPWPAKAAPQLDAALAAEWDARFVAAHAAVDVEDTIRGCVIGLMESPDEKTYEVLTWAADAKGAFADEPLGALPWPTLNPIESMQVRVRTEGVPAVLLRDLKGERHLFDGGGFAGPIAEPYRRTPLPIELAFMNDANAVLIVARIGGGFEVRTPAGGPLPPKPL